MALNFLAALPYITTGLQLFGQAKGLQQAFKSPEQTAAEKKQLQAIANQERLLKAITDPDDVILRNVAAAEEKLMRQEAARQLQNIMRASRRQQAMGRTTFFDPERRDEAASAFATQMAQRAAPRARASALDRILQAATGMGYSYRYIGWT